MATAQGANFGAFMRIDLFPGGLAVERGRLVLGDRLQVDPAELERFDDGTIALLERLRWWDLPEETIRSALPVLTGGTGQELADLVARLRG